jgi:hypothetical protein
VGLRFRHHTQLQAVASEAAPAASATATAAIYATMGTATVSITFAIANSFITTTTAGLRSSRAAHRQPLGIVV